MDEEEDEEDGRKRGGSLRNVAEYGCEGKYMSQLYFISFLSVLNLLFLYIL